MSLDALINYPISFLEVFVSVEPVANGCICRKLSHWLNPSPIVHSVWTTMSERKKLTFIFCHFETRGCDRLSVTLIASITRNCARFEFDSFWWINQNIKYDFGLFFFSLIGVSNTVPYAMSPFAGCRSQNVYVKWENHSYRPYGVYCRMPTTAQTLTDSIFLIRLCLRRTDDWAEIIHLNKNWT